MKKSLACTAAALAALVSVGANAMGNPASLFCGKMGGKSVVAKLASGDEIGLCELPGRKVVEEWTLYRMFDGKKPVSGKNPFNHK